MATSAGDLAVGAYGVSAGLDLMSGVFGYLSSLNAASIAQSQASLMVTAAEANAQRYSEQAAQSEAQQKAMYLASGVTLAGSPVDALATSARLANENITSILMGGEREAEQERMAGVNAEMQGRSALVGGLGQATGALTKGALTASLLGMGGGGGTPAIGALASGAGYGVDVVSPSAVGGYA